MSVHSKIISVGTYLPKNCVSNNDLPKHLETSDEWIISRTGITQRYIAAENEFTSDLATNAAREALKKAGLQNVDAIIVATTTPDSTFPSTSSLVQKKLGLKNCFAFDIQAVCSGFVYALSVADSFIKSGQIKTALVIGAETLTRILDWNDRGTCVLFGDGAGAVVVTVSDKPGIIASKLYTDGEFYDELYVDGGPSQQKLGVLKMNGKEVFKNAVEKMSGSIESAVADNGFALTDVNWVVPHQANLRIMDAIAKRLNLDSAKVVETVSKHANTSAASIPLALAHSWNNFKPNDLIVLTALGGGFTWGSVLVRW